MKRLFQISAVAMFVMPCTLALTSCGKGAHHVKAGGWLCNTQVDAVRYDHYKRVINRSGYAGCTQTGDDMEVNILGHASLAGSNIVNVGNSGGAAWTSEDDVD